MHFTSHCLQYRTQPAVHLDVRYIGMYVLLHAVSVVHWALLYGSPVFLGVPPLSLHPGYFDDTPKKRKRMCRRYQWLFDLLLIFECNCTQSHSQSSTALQTLWQSPGAVLPHLQENLWPETWDLLACLLKAGVQVGGGWETSHQWPEGQVRFKNEQLCKKRNPCTMMAVACMGGTASLEKCWEHHFSICVVTFTLIIWSQWHRHKCILNTVERSVSLRRRLRKQTKLAL